MNGSGGQTAYTITASNAAHGDPNAAAAQAYTIVVSAAATAPIITTARLPQDAPVGTPYTQTITATGTAPITFSVTGGALPPGLTLDPDTGQISGTPTTTGTYTFTITATNSAGTDSKGFAIQVIRGLLDATPIPTLSETALALLALLLAAAARVRRTQG
jgi:hypothetical protein